MHSYIYQISQYPIGKDEYIGQDHIVAGEMASIDYCEEIEPSEHMAALHNLVGRVLPACMVTINPDGTSLTYHGGFTEWNREYVKSLLVKATSVNETNVFKYIGPTYQLQKAIVNPLGTDSLFVTEYTDGIGTAERSRELMRIIGELQIGEKLYIGAILNYHA